MVLIAKMSFFFKFHRNFLFVFFFHPKMGLRRRRHALMKQCDDFFLIFSFVFFFGNTFRFPFSSYFVFRGKMKEEKKGTKRAKIKMERVGGEEKKKGKRTRESTARTGGNEKENKR